MQFNLVIREARWLKIFYSLKELLLHKIYIYIYSSLSFENFASREQVNKSKQIKHVKKDLFLIITMKTNFKLLLLFRCDKKITANPRFMQKRCTYTSLRPSASYR